MKICEKCKTIPDFLNLLNQGFQQPQALSFKIEGKWVALSTAEVLCEIESTAYSLISLGVKKGDRIAIMGIPCPRWIIADLAIMSIGAISIPLFYNISNDNFLYEIQNTQPKFIFVIGEDAWKKAEAYPFDDGQVISLEYHGLEYQSVSRSAMSYNAFLTMGKALKQKEPGAYTDRTSQVKADDVGKIIYTSGSTGLPKGVVLLQKGLTAFLGAENFLFSPEDRYINVIPLPHIFGHMTNYAILAYGAKIYFPDDPKELISLCPELQPTVIVLVPRLLEKIQGTLWVHAIKQNGLKHRVGLSALHLASQGKIPWYKKPLQWLADCLIYRKIRNAFGGKVRFVFSSSTTLNPDLSYFFYNIGMPVLDGYGLTESPPVSSHFCKTRIKPGTVGPVVKGVNVKINPDGEILVKSIAVMKEYYHNPEATSAAFDEEGWFKTGDLGSYDDEKYLVLNGRKQDLFKSSSGLSVAPSKIEQLLTAAPLVESALVIGENRRCVVCLLFPDHDVLAKLKASNSKYFQSDEEFLNSSMIQREMQEFIDTLNNKLNKWEKIQRYKFINYRLTIKDGDLTPSLKLKRDFLIQKFAKSINMLYETEESAVN